ncbi:caspase family protein [Bradyrhizobium diazoefficiens]|uniref:caspase family protein n=1 Tax=Bradyrhizobium diazoefficiens TaxID=1355477 RepID=UPI00190DDEC1|nr:caspase family protein [Bradyrhizobium diazoefficiens]QQO17205.1 caspase family protein [Bradyrhizobium diazoefficiens]
MFRLKSFIMTAGLLGSLFGFACGPVSAQVAPVEPAPTTLQGPEQRVALVIGNSKYQNAPQLQNPDNDAQSMAQFLNSAGFEVVAATDLSQNDMLRVVQDFSAKVSARGPNTVAMVYYAGHGVQLAGENYLVPVDAKVSSPTELVNNSVRLVDVMSTLEAIPSRMRIVILDACRNNPFPNVNDAGRGLAIVDAPNGSIVGYSTAPGAEALDGTGGHSPYTQAFLNVAREPNVPIEQLFKRVRLAVNQTTSGAQIPWESSSLTSDFTFFGDTAVAASRAPVNAPVVQMASNLPSRSTRQAYDYVVSEGRPEYYQEFIQMYPHDPLCDHIRWLLNNLLISQAWHKAVLANSPLAYKSFYDSYGNSPYAQVALKLQAEPKQIPLMQATKFLAPQNITPSFKIGNLGQPKYMQLMQQGNGGPQMNGNLPIVQKPVDGNVIGKLGNGGQIVNLPAGNNQPNGAPSPTPGKIVTLPAPISTTNNHAGAIGKIVTLPATNNNTPNAGNGNPGKIVSMPVNVGKGGATVEAKPVVQTQNNPVRVDNGNTGIVKLNNNPVNKVQVQNNQQNTRPQFNTTNRMVSNGSNNFRQSMNQAPSMGGNNHRSFMH